MSKVAYFFKKTSINIVLFAVSIVLSLLLVEGILRIRPSILGYEYANKMLNEYADNYLEYDPYLKMEFMKPNFETTCYWNGYRWKHKTDCYGFRNPTCRKKADIVLLGDSYIYGHGLDQEQTVGHFIERITGHSVVNLAQRGDCTFQQNYKLHEYGFKFKPEYVFYFFFANDIHDLTFALSDDDKIKFINTPLEDITFEPRRSYDYPSSKTSQIYKCYSCQAIKFVKHKYEELKSKGFQYSSEENPAEDVNSLGWQYTRKALLKMKSSSESHSAKFIIVFILEGDYSPGGDDEKRLKILREFAEQNHIPFIYPQSMETETSFFLPHDGHFSEKGAREMAKIVAGWIAEYQKEP